ncbi:hypothetical protein WJX72_008332 [[Myrmecia] bisecta]|uniref:Uncharacterized protein n=1 Tax=[Myrmecia] bisecta TaxID=41462 RepID=A0AAW1R933_9CHLO
MVSGGIVILSVVGMLAIGIVLFLCKQRNVVQQAHRHRADVEAPRPHILLPIQQGYFVEQPDGGVDIASKLDPILYFKSPESEQPASKPSAGGDDNDVPATAAYSTDNSHGISGG